MRYIILDKLIHFGEIFMAFEIFDGSPTVKNMLEILLHEKGSKETGLEEFLKDLDETESSSGNFWVALDSKGQPRGALTVRYLNDLSYLRSVWTRVSKVDDAKVASKELLKRWIKTARRGTKIFQADLPMYSPITSSILDAGFNRDRVLLTSYDLETGWLAEDLPEGYIMRPVQREEHDLIYRKLVAPDLDPASPIYVSPEAFRNFSIQLPDSALKSWVCVEDDQGEIVGFGASFLSLERNETKAVLYGPHSIESDVIRAIIAETSSFWRSNDIDQLRILRVSEFHPNIINHFNLKQTHSTIRYIKK
jgi:hypothetical protein